MIHSLKRLVSSVTLLGLFSAMFPAAFAEETPPPAPEPDSRIDRTHESVSGYIIKKADDLDDNLHRLLTPEEMERNQTFGRFFGDRSVEKTDSRARIEVGIGVEWSETEGFDFDHDFSGKIDLPRTEKRLRFVFDSLSEEEDSLAAFNRNQSASADNTLREQDAKGSAAIQAALGKIFNIRFTADVGMDFNPEPVPKVKFTAGIPWNWGETEYRISQRVFWESEDGFGEKTSLEIRRFFGDSFFIKTDTAAVWSETSEGVDLGQTILMRQLFHKDSTVGITLGARAYTEPKTTMEVYLIRFPLRTPIYKNWIYLVVEPGADFHDDYDWEFSPLISVKTQFYFGRL